MEAARRVSVNEQVRENEESYHALPMVTPVVLTRPVKFSAVSFVATPGESRQKTPTDVVFAARTYTKLHPSESLVF